MATEPRLAPRLEDPLTLMRSLHPSGSLQLPPLQDPRPSDPASRPLPLEPSTSAHRDDPADATSSLSSRATEKVRKADAAKVLSKDIASAKLDGPPGQPDASSDSLPKPRITKDQSLPRHGPESPRKRRRVDNVKAPADFVQLPNPTQKPPQFTKPAPATLSALQDPPPNAALFPPISTEAFPEEKAVQIKAPAPKPRNTKSASTIKASKKQSTRPRKKWTEEETDDLLRGVALFGIGCWKKILSHSEFTFNNRSSIDLKDRFRTCCPDAYRKHISTSPSDGASPGAGKITGDGYNGTPVKPLPSILTENILIASDPPTNPSPSPPKVRKSRSHRKNSEDLARLGIEGPFRKAARRERRAFRPEEDESLLKGYNKYGPMWSRIRNDPTLNLGERRATDLRDRFRNRYPDKYAEAGFKSRPRGNSKAATEYHNQIVPLSVAAEAIAKKKMLEREKEREELKYSRERSEGDHEEDGYAESFRPGMGSSEENSDDGDDGELMVGGSMFDDWNENTLAPFQSSSDTDLHRLFDNINPMPPINRRPPPPSSSHSIKLAPVLSGPKYSSTSASPNTARNTPTPSTGKSKASLSTIVPNLPYPNSTVSNPGPDTFPGSQDRAPFTLPGPSEIITPSALEYDTNFPPLNSTNQSLTNSTPTSSITGIQFKPADILKRARAHHSLNSTTSSTGQLGDTTNPTGSNASSGSTSAVRRQGSSHVPSLATNMDSMAGNPTSSGAIHMSNSLGMNNLNAPLSLGINGLNHLHMPMPMPMHMHHPSIGGHNQGQAPPNPAHNQAHSGGGITPISISNHLGPGLNLPLHGMPMNSNMNMPMNLHLSGLNMGMPMGITPLNNPMMGSFGAMGVGMPVGVGLGIENPTSALMWEDMANHPIFDIENAAAGGGGAGSAPGPGSAPGFGPGSGPIPGASTDHVHVAQTSSTSSSAGPMTSQTHHFSGTDDHPMAAAPGIGRRSSTTAGGRPNIVSGPGPSGPISYSSLHALRK